MTHPWPFAKRVCSGPVVSAAVVFITWFLIAARAIPGRDGDRGIFVSVAERINAGDRLYMDVWDQKDPLFYYVIAAGRLISPYMDIAIELGWLALAGFAGWQLARAAGLGQTWSLIVGASLVPFVLTGVGYIPGFSHLPGTALALMALALTTTRRYVLAGLLFGLLLFLKLTTAPVALLMVLVFIWQVNATRSVKRLVGGTLIAIVGVVSLLALRGELVGYVTMLQENFLYSDGSWMGKVTNPVLKRIELTMTIVATTTAVMTAGILSLAYASPDINDEKAGRPASRALLSASLVGLATALVVIALTGLRYHHAQVLALPAATTLIAAAALVPQLRRQQWSGLIAILAIGFVLSGGTTPQLVVQSVVGAPTRVRDLTPLDETTSALLATGQASTYARIGSNDDNSHAMGLAEWRLACPRFHQYAHLPPTVLDDVVDCLTTSQFVVVDSSVGENHSLMDGYEAVPDFFDNWNAFVRDAEAALSANFTCQAFEWGRLCRNTSQVAVH